MLPSDRSRPWTCPRSGNRSPKSNDPSVRQLQQDPTGNEANKLCCLFNIRKNGAAQIAVGDQLVRAVDDIDESEYIKVRIARRRESAFDVAAAEFYASLRRVQGVSTENQGTPTSGLSRASIASLPIIIIGAKGEGINSEHEKSCPICLSNYEHREALRVLPECLHRFHAVCVDEWLRANATCPICRITPPLFSATV